MTYASRTGLAVLALASVLVLPGGAAPVGGPALTRAQAYDGFFKRLFHPKVDLGHTVRAIAYPVTKTAGNGAKAVMDGGKTATTAAVAAAASGYAASKRPGISTFLPKK